MLRVALVGLGDAGQHHARALMTLEAAGELQWTAMCARDAGRIAAFRIAHGVPERVAVFTDYAALLAARACDAVILATPDGLHAEQVERAAAHATHVLVEKPLALARADAERAARAFERAGTLVRVGYHLRHHAGHALVQRKLDALIGDVRHVYVRWAWPDPATDGWRARGENARAWSLAALGTHGVDLALWLARGRATRVRAILERRGSVDVAAELSLALAGGALAHVSVAVTHRAQPRLVVAGERGEIDCAGTLGARGAGDIVLRAGREPPRPLAFEPVDPYVAQLRAFATDARTPPQPDDALADAVENVAILEQALREEPA